MLPAFFSELIMYAPYPLRAVAGYDYPRSYDQEYADTLHQEHAEQRAKELLDGEYSPDIPKNFIEALGEIASYHEFGLKMAETPPEQRLQVLEEFVVDYWNRMANQKAGVSE